MNIQYTVSILLLLLFSCKTINKTASGPSSTNDISFHWETVELNGEMREKAAISVPFIMESAPYKFKCQLDLGSYNSIIYENSIETLRTTNQEFADSIISNKDLSIVYLNTVRLGTYEVSDHKFQLYEDYGDHYTKEDYQSDITCNICTIGSDVFRDKKLLIDYPNQKLKVLDSLTPNHLTDFVFTPIYFEEGYIKIALLINGKEEQFMFDTGSSMFALIVSPKKWDYYRDDSAAIDTLTVTSWGERYDIYGSPINISISSDMITFNTDSHRVYSNHLYADFFESQSISGVVGNVFFLDKKIILDYQNKQLGIEKV